MPNLIQRLAGAFRTPKIDNQAFITTADSSASLNDFFNVATSASGYVVNESTAMTVAAVYRCVALIGGAISQLPLHQYRKTKDGRERLPVTPLWWLLNESPHDNWTAASWKEYLVKSVLLRGDSFAQIIRSPNSDIVGIEPLHPNRVLTYQMSDGHLFYQVNNLDGSRRPMVDQDDMLHFAGLGYDGVRSMSIIQWAAKQGIGNSLAAGDYAGKTFADGVIPQIALKYPNKFGPDQAAGLRESFAAVYGGIGGRRLPLILAEGGDVKELSLTPEDAQLLVTRQYEKNDIYTAFGVPPIMGGDSEKVSSWGTGIEQITIGFVRYTLKPHLVRWEEEFNRKLFRNAGLFVEFNVDALLRGDTKAQADYFKAALGGPGSGPGWMSVNEIRSLQNLPPAPDGDKIFYPQDAKAGYAKQTTQPA